MNTSLMVADIGNSSIHLGEFRIGEQSTQLPNPVRSTSVPGHKVDDVVQWINDADPGTHRWRVGSVNKQGLDPLLTWIESRNERVQVVTYKDFDISVIAKRPEKIGIDRLAAATAADRLRLENHAAIIVDAGTAITIDCVTAAGQYIGGMIAPGIQSGFTSLEQNTDQLPATKLDPSPCLIADNTTHAIQAGVYWMTVGGIENIIAKLKDELAGPCNVFLTGGSMNAIYPNLQLAAKHVPDLVLSGLAIANS